MITYLQKLFRKHTGLAISLLCFLLFYGGEFLLKYTDKMLVQIEQNTEVSQDNKVKLDYIQDNLRDIKRQNSQNNRALGVLIGKVDILQRRQTND